MGHLTILLSVRYKRRTPQDEVWGDPGNRRGESSRAATQRDSTARDRVLK
jgi:hypothetical protein